MTETACDFPALLLEQTEGTVRSRLTTLTDADLPAGDARWRALTDQGRATAERLHAISARHLEAALVDWSEDERARLAASLDRLVHDLRATPLADDDVG